MTQTVALIFAGLGALAALFLNFRARASAAEASNAWAENEKLAEDLKSVREQLGKQSGKLAKHDEDVAALRKRLDKAKRRTHSAPGAGTESASVTSLERDAELEEARQARDGARSEADSLAAEVSRLRAKLALKPEPKPVPESTELAELRVDRAQAVADLAKSQEAQEELRRGKARLKKKVDNQELLYVALRTELEVKKDRLRAQQEVIERLQALEVSLGGASGGGTQVADADVSEPEQAAEVGVVPDVSAESPVESESTRTQGPSE
jgi:chromosome segregation ATPase